MKKTCLVFGLIGGFAILGCGGFGFLIFGGIYMLTAGMVSSADGFLENAASDNFPGSYAYLCNEFQDRVTAEQLERFIRENRLNEFESALWNSRSVENDTGTLEGSVTTRSGVSIPVKMKFVKERDQWKIVAIEQTPVAISEIAEPIPDESLPAEQEQ